MLSNGKLARLAFDELYTTRFTVITSMMFGTLVPKDVSIDAEIYY